MRLRRSSWWAVLALVVGTSARADDAFFRRCEIERRAALVNGDTATLGRLMADGAQYIHSNGEIDDEAKLKQRLASGALRYRMIVANEENYACNATGCEVSGTQTLDVSAEGRDFSMRNRFRVTWLNVAGACQFVAYQSSPLAK
jgi:hypothetical protein